MKILSIIAFAGAALGLQQQQTSSSKGVDFLGRNGLTSEYLKTVADTVNSERKTAVNKEINSADKMMKYYQNIIEKSKKNLKEIRSIRSGEPQRAMMDLNSKFSATSYWDNNWKNPRLDSRYGVHNHGSQSGKPQ